MYIKSSLLAEGLNIDESIQNLSNFNQKKYHLYDHSPETPTFTMPEDIILHYDEFTQKPVIARNRFNSKSPWVLKSENDQLILQGPHTRLSEVDFPTPTNFGDLTVNEEPLDQVATKLGVDLCGVILSNYCFYFGSKTECRFCEILPTYLERRAYPQATKRTSHVVEACTKAIMNDSSFSHIVLTTGNVGTYDYTCELFEEIGEGLKGLRRTKNVKLTGTLMPPTNFAHIDKLKQAGFDNVYFDLEVFDRHLFKTIAPGKEEYGYDKLIDALTYAVDVFGKGHVFTNLIYGIQTLDSKFDTSKTDFKEENKKAMDATHYLLDLNIAPVFTIYHSSGKNAIGPMKLDGDYLYEFFKSYGEAVFESGLIPEERKAMIFSLGSTTNTMYNDAYVLAALKNKEKIIGGKR